MISNDEHSIKMMAPKWLYFILFSIGFIGFADALYLTVKHYIGSDVLCSIFDGCELVTTSGYSLIFNIPVALLGVIFYIIVFTLVFFTIKNSDITLLISLITVTAIGFLVSIWFVYLQLVVIGAICLYCMISALTSALLFIFSLLMLRYNKSDKTNPKEISGL